MAGFYLFSFFLLAAKLVQCLCQFPEGRTDIAIKGPQPNQKRLSPHLRFLSRFKLLTPDGFK